MFSTFLSLFTTEAQRPQRRTFYIDDKQDEVEFLQAHLSKFMISRGMFARIQRSINLLDADFKSEISLNHEERGKFIMMAKKECDAYLQILDDSLQEQKRYYNQLDNDVKYRFSAPSVTLWL